MRSVGWALTFLVGAVLFYACTLLPPIGNDTTASFHGVSRYEEQGRAETGFTNLTAAVAGDYRGWDLFTLGFLVLVALLSGRLYTLEGEGAGAGAHVWSCAWMAAALGIGWACLHSGVFLDYEFFSRFFPAAFARRAGAALLAGSVFSTWAGFLFLLRGVFREKGGRHGR